DQLAYCATKGALTQMTKSMALALAKYGIRVNAIGPGSINTDVLKAVNDNPEAMDKIMSRTPLGRIGDPDEIASIASFLASKDASYMTGTTLYADGGRMAMNYTVPKD
ncbi:MAG: SDR family oxidoreductase, partial [Pseudomonadota bacterium]|nr:SDR family oxidoreductase [Pseudomonadota bacterium]